MRLTDFSIRKKLLLNFVLLIGGILAISIVSTLSIHNFRSVLNELLNTTVKENTRFQLTRYNLAKLESGFYNLFSAPDLKRIKQTNEVFENSLTNLNANLVALEHAGLINTTAKNTGVLFSNLFHEIKDSKIRNLTIKQECSELLKAFSHLIDEDKNHLYTLLDNNELSIFSATTLNESSSGYLENFISSTYGLAKNTLDLLNALSELELAATRILSIEDSDYISPKKEKLFSALENIHRLANTLGKELPEKDKAILNQAVENFPLFKEMLLSDDGILEKQALYLQSRDEYNKRLHDIISKIKEVTAKATQYANDIAGTAHKRGEQVISRLNRIVTSISLIVLLLIFVGSWLSIMITNSISKPLTQGVEFASSIASGNFHVSFDLDRQDEIGDLANALNHMAKTLREEDERKNAEDWLINGKGHLDDTLRGEQDIERLCQTYISFLVKYIDAKLGLVYLVTQQGDTLHLIASHAFSERDGNYNKLNFGQGLVGQAALERQTLIFNNLLGNAPSLNFSVGRKIPPHFAILPLVYDDEVLGVIQLGGFNPFSELDKRFLERCKESISIALQSAQSRNKVQQLLHETREQAEALKAHQIETERTNKELEEQAAALRSSEAKLQEQQEELRIINEELQEQTKALQESQVRLQQQQEELRVTNEELEERNQALQDQKDATFAQNRKLEKIQGELELKAEEVERASRYKTEFLANMSHELRTPLNSIIILSQLLAADKECTLSEKQKEFANTVYSSGQDLLSLINEILDLAKVESGKIDIAAQPVVFDELTGSLYRIFSPLAAQKSLSLSFNVAEDLPENITTDPQRVQQILRNLLSNAVKFTEQGSITMTIRPGDPAQDPADLPLPPASAVVFTVNDTGIGIPPDKQDIIFEAFQQADGTTSRKYGGTGLGLSISRQMAALLGGELRMHSSPGKGSSFMLYLPQHFDTLNSRARTQDREGKPKRKHAPRRPECDIVAAETLARLPDSFPRDDRENICPEDRTLLIIEDDSGFVPGIMELAHSRGFKCLLAPDGESGLHLVQAFSPSAVVLDVTLPGIDGWQVMEHLKGSPETRHIPVHFISAADEHLEGMKMGAIGFLQKPVTIQELEHALFTVEEALSSPVKKLLLVEDDPQQQRNVKELIGNSDVITTAVATGEEALELLDKESFDCMILDLRLQGMSGFDLLAKIRQADKLSNLPIIVYTAQDLTADEQANLSRFAERIIIKGARSPERLLDETTLFLHRVETNLPKAKQRLIRMVHDKETELQGKRILIVDDDMRNLFALAGILEERGMEVLEAANGKDCLTRLEKNPDVDIVLMDIMMPEMDGYEAIREIRRQERFHKLPIIALTAKAMKDDRTKCIQAGANDYLSKPVETRKLLSLLRVWLHGDIGSA